MTDHRNLLDKMRNMTKELLANGPQSATAVIQQALRDAGLKTSPGEHARAPAAPSAQDAPAMRDINPPPAGKTGAGRATAGADAAAHSCTDSFADSAADDTYAGSPSRAQASAGSPMAGLGGRLSQALDGLKTTGSAAGLGDFVPDLLSRLGAGVGASKVHVTGGVAIPQGAQFISGTYANAAGMRHYKLYLPAGHDGRPLPLVVMLHGCTQDPDDFARGTQMNAAAEQHRCMVLYPQQSASANSSKCWNWFSANDQQRDSGEPSILAGMTRDVAARYQADPRQIYIAGLSAGGAMAAIMGTVYPDLYAGVGVHSGLPYGAATDLPSALAAMRGGMAHGAQAVRSAKGLPAFKGIPIIVFHGDADHTVNVRNGDQVMANTAPAGPDTSRQIRSEGRVVGGHAYTRTVQNDDGGNAVAEHWLVHGFGHAWAGGSPSGTFTDARGPDATQEMMRFFYTHKNPA